jgi:peptidyl-prolyl cis-trans isomerase D
MISAFRKKLRNGIMLAILGVGLIAIVITGFGTDGFGGLGGAGGGTTAQEVAEVAGESITDAELSMRMNSAFRRMAAEQPTLDRAQFVEANFNALIEEVIDGEALTAFARSLGFVVPQTMIDRVIVSIPGFLNVAGQFDDATFRAALSQQGLTERQLREDIENSQLIRMVAGPVGGGVRVPNAVASEYANLLLERRTGLLGAVPAQLLAQGIQPSDQEIAAFYQQNQRSFALPERRVLRFALIGREQLGDAVRATDQEIAAHYQQNQAQYGPRETRNIQRIVLGDEAAARAFADRVRGGADFAQAAAQAGFAPADINFPQQSREQFTTASNAEIAGAAFGAQQGAVLGPFRTPLGFQVVRVEGVSRTAGRPIETVRAEIIAAVEQRKLSEQLTALAERIEEQLADGASFQEIAQAQRLNVQTSPPMSATGAGQNFQFPQQLAPLLQAAFEVSAEDDPEIAVVQPDAQVALIQVAQVLPPAAPPLEQIRDQVRQRLIQQTALQRARAIADGIVNRINGGMAAAQAFAQAGVRLPNPETLTLTRFQISRQGQQVPPPLTILFSIPQGRARVIAAPNNGGWIIVHHQQRVAGNAARDPNGAQVISATQQEVSQSAEAELQSQFARAVRATVSVERNEERLQALRQRLITGQ